MKSVKQKAPGDRRRDALANVERAVVQLLKLGGRGVLVPGGYILTAAHCVDWDHSGGMVLGEYYHEKVKTADGQTLVLSVLAVEPVADIAVLGEPDNQEFYDEAEAFEQFTKLTRPVPLFRDKMKPFDRHRQPSPGAYSVSVRVLNQDRSWLKATAQVTSHDDPTVCLDADQFIDGGASGGPIVTADGKLVAIVSNCGRTVGSTPLNGVKRGFRQFQFVGNAPRPLTALPVWMSSAIKRVDVKRSR